MSILQSSSPMCGRSPSGSTLIRYRWYGCSAKLPFWMLADEFDRSSQPDSLWQPAISRTDGGDDRGEIRGPSSDSDMAPNRGR